MNVKLGLLALFWILGFSFIVGFFTMPETEVASSCPAHKGQLLPSGQVVALYSIGRTTSNCKIMLKLNDGSFTDWDYAFKYME